MKAKIKNSEVEPGRGGRNEAMRPEKMKKCFGASGRKKSRVSGF